MNVYGIYNESGETFVEYQMCIYINLHKVITLLSTNVLYETKINDIFQDIKIFLHAFGIDMGEYDEHHFVYINNQGEEEKLFDYDWNCFIRDLDICSPLSSVLVTKKDEDCLFHMMKFEQTHGNVDTNLYKLEKMIGLKESFVLPVVPPDEYSIFERFSKKLLLNFNQEISNWSLESRLLHEHPIHMSNAKPLSSSEISISIGLEQFENNKSKSNKTFLNRTIMIKVNSTIISVISQILKKLKERGETVYNSEDYLLRLADREEYLVANTNSVELIKFKYIEDCLSLKKQAELILIPKKIVENEMTNIPRIPRASVIDGPIFTNVNENSFKEGILTNGQFIYIHDLWKRFSNSENYTESISSDYSKIKCDSILQSEDLLYSIVINRIDLQSDVSIPKDQKIIIMAGLYHGKESLCEHQYCEFKGNPGEICFCNVFFPIEIWNLPRMARLSFCLMSVKQNIFKDFASVTQKKYMGWGNIMIYDNRAILRTETIVYSLWNSGKQGLNPTASIYSNPDGKVIAAQMTIEMLPKLKCFNKIVYPPKDVLIQEAGLLIGTEHQAMPNQAEKDKMKEILKRSSMDDIMEDEQDLLWKYRYYIRDYFQDSLPRMLNTRPWNNFVNVAKMHHLACGWPVEKDILIALELLGPDSFDSDIRMIAVDSLQRLSWQEFSLYLLQICQCLKYESYLNSNFIRMFLKRMTQNAKIAQSIFYYMKVEMSACDWCKVTFCIILFNYLQYSPARCKSLLRQYNVTSELGLHNKALQQFSSLEGDKKAQVLKKFRDTLSLAENQKIFNDLPNPIDPNIVLKTMDPKMCKFMDSKMRPVRLLWTVNESFKKEYSLIYKKGDDLRQDALIVQMLHIMDAIWHNAGLDLKLSPYEVLACSKTEGYIQVVQKAETLANIYKLDRNKNRKLFYDWLKVNTTIDMSVVVQNFKRSCAAYCVATFILGIGDRHSDNIMITTEGHLFHIDFGHILGNFKKIMGGMVSREWTKFILVQDFLDVVTNCVRSDQKEAEFRDLCCAGYIELRKHSRLIFSLFKMMLSADIPEISSLDDLNYLKETLQLGKSENDAINYFQNVYNDTLKKEMFISLNWVAHNIRRNNN